MQNLLILAGFILLIVLASSVRKDRMKKIIFFGDSLTQAGLLPGGYITVLQNMLQRSNITNYEIVGAGINGNKIYDLYLRVERDVIALSPLTAVIFIGVNDVWHKRSKGTGTDADKFEKFYQAVIYKLRSSGIKVVLCTPPAIGEKTDHSNPQDEDLDHYCNIIRKIAAENELPLVDLRTSFLDYNLFNNPGNLDKGILTTDGVHLNDKGSKLVAGQMWEVLRDVR